MFKILKAKTDIRENNFDLKFASPIYRGSSDTSKYVINSTPFLINGVTHFFGDKPIKGSINRTVIAYKVIDGVDITTLNEVGIIETATGKVRINNFTVDSDIDIKITVTPDSLDIAPKRDQLLNIDSSYVNIKGEIDTISTSGSSGTIDYTTNSRFR